MAEPDWRAGGMHASGAAAPGAQTPATAQGAPRPLPRVLLLVLVLGLVAAFYDGLVELARLWMRRPEYSHGFMIPLVAFWMASLKFDALRREPANGSWLGVGVVFAGLALLLVGEFTGLYVVVHYAMLLTTTGTVATVFGLRALRILWAPLVFLVFMVPLPPFLHNQLSGVLQLVSSELGVALIRLLGISVHIEGNVIDLGIYQLQVVEACDGLRYIFPLTSFAFLCAYLYRGPVWHRVVLFLSAAPIAVVMNAVRIAIIGFLVEHYGIGAAEGFLHDFEGWAVFMVCVGALLLQVVVLSRLRGGLGSLREALVVELPARGFLQGLRARPRSRRPVGTAAVLVICGAILVPLAEARPEIAPPRAPLGALALELDGWQPVHSAIPQNILRALKLSDYTVIDYLGPPGEVVNLYVAYYASQRKGEAAHSPRSCIPGGGWEIEDLGRAALPDAAGNGAPLDVNRVVIARGDQQQLVYYWFEQRGRLLTNEYLVKAYLLWDALTRNRTDGALVRLVTPIGDGGAAAADAKLSSFAAAVRRQIPAHVPG